MKDYYFTFGQNHQLKTGKNTGLLMNDFWVRVTADTIENAKEIFITKFTSKFMENPDNWAFQYEENQFEKKWFPKGEYEHFKG